jgi:hypothetical protein
MNDFLVVALSIVIPLAVLFIVWLAINGLILIAELIFNAIFKNVDPVRRRNWEGYVSLLIFAIISISLGILIIGLSPPWRP